MGRQKVRKEVGASIRETIQQRISKLVIKMKGDSMSDKGWKAIVIVGIWASVAVMVATTGTIDEAILSGVGLVSIFIAFLF